MGSLFANREGESIERGGILARIGDLKQLSSVNIPDEDFNVMNSQGN